MRPFAIDEPGSSVRALYATLSDTKVKADDIAENAWICVVTSKDQLLLNHAPRVYTLIHSDLTLTCFDFELYLRVLRHLFNITIYFLIP